MTALHRSRREHVARPDRDASGATEGAHGGAPLSPRQSQDDPRVLETHNLRLDGPLHSDMICAWTDLSIPIWTVAA